VLDDRVQRRREIFDYYRQAFKDVPGIECMPEADYGRANRWLSVILITPEQFGADTEAVRLALKAENIESRPVWKPMHMQPVFQTTHPCRTVGGSVSEDLFTRGLCLPSGTAMTPED
jgi:dTDP-4-amino-4,6-dideoxygalactose transaminase